MFGIRRLGRLGPRAATRFDASLPGFRQRTRLRSAEGPDEWTDEAELEDHLAHCVQEFNRRPGLSVCLRRIELEAAISPVVEAKGKSFGAGWR